MHMQMRGIARGICTLGIIGALVSAQQVRAESVFAGRGAASLEKLTLQPLVLAGIGAPSAVSCALGFSPLAGDTLETFDVQVEEEKGPGITKQLIVFGIITAAVGYAVIELMKSDSEPMKAQKPGKTGPDLPGLTNRAEPLTRSR
jgi:hypothetical protein